MLDTEAFYKLVESRKSIRRYQQKPVPRELLEKILMAGMHAPSGKNLQNWRLFVLQDSKLQSYLKLSQKSWEPLRPVLEKRLKPSLYKFTERFFYTLGYAPVMVFFYALCSREERYLTSVGSVYMCVQNIILAATCEGLGTCAMGAPLEIENEVNAFLNIPQQPIKADESLKLLCALVMGYPDHEPPKAPRKIQDRVVWVK